MFWLIVLAATSLIVFGPVGAYVAAQKGRAPAEGYVLGFLLGPIGVVVVGLLPTIDAPARRSEPEDYRDDEPLPAKPGPMRIQPEKPEEAGLDIDLKW